MGWPRRGAVTVHRAGTFAYEQGAEFTARVTGAFGPAEELTVLDLGCGPGETDIARQVLGAPWRRLIQVEAFGPYAGVMRAKTPAAATRELHEMRIPEIFGAIAAGEADIAVMNDVLEHFERGEALALLRRLERFVRRGIVLFSPVGEVAQEPYDGNELQRHRSFWEAEDWARLGYDVEVYEAFHGQLDPPATAAWAIKKLQ
jgi:2-polyprenyl-3-methyl-5-hydroxy-6-metoxy-1,4-benzoquinol methylase